MANPANQPFAEHTGQGLIEGIALREATKLGGAPDTATPCATHAGHNVLFG
jgi:hypothetical protein